MVQSRCAASSNSSSPAFPPADQHRSAEPEPTTPRLLLVARARCPRYERSGSLRLGWGWRRGTFCRCCARRLARVFFNIAGCTCIFVCVVAGIGRCCSGGLRPPRRRSEIRRSEIDATVRGQNALSGVLRFRLRLRPLVGRLGLRLRRRGFLLQLPQLIPQPRKLAHTRTFLAPQQFQILVDLRHQQVAGPSRERSLLRGDGFLPRLRRLAQFGVRQVPQFFPQRIAVTALGYGNLRTRLRGLVVRVFLDRLVPFLVAHGAGKGGRSRGAETRGEAQLAQ